MVYFPNCKINLGLFITERRSDGYHNLETIFLPLGLKDALEIVPSGSGMTTLRTVGLPVEGSSDNNLVMRAYRLLRDACPDRITPIEIWLYKHIPMGAGLGGGSADGAFMLRMLNEYFSLGLSTEALIAYALQLGSDCPFFIINTPQFASGRGEKMMPVSIDLSGYRIRLICPRIHISTGRAFQMIRPAAPVFDLRELGNIPVAEWKHVLINDFEAPVFSEQPKLKAIKEQLYAQGAVYAAMSGTGSTIYGIFPHEINSEKLIIDVPFTEWEGVLL